MSTLNQRMANLNKKFKTFTKTQYIPTGSLIMDIVMGGGLPVGKMIELASDAGAGKTTIVLSMCRELLRQGKKIIYLDHEGAVSTSQLEGTGVLPYLNCDENPEGNFHLFQVMTYSESEEILDALLGSREFALVVIDSVTSMISDEYLANAIDPDTKEKSRSVTDVMPAEDARILGKFLKKFKAVCTKFDTSMILINQLRTNLNITGGMSSKISTGGAAVEFFPDIRLRLEKPQVFTGKRETINGKEDMPIGCIATIYAYKNKMTNGKIKIPITIVFGKGISNLGSYRSWLPNKMVEFDGEKIPMLLVKGGGYNVLTLNGKQYNARGEDALIALLKEHFDEIKACFSVDDFKIAKDEGYAEFEASGERNFEVEPDEPFEKENETVIVEGWNDDEEDE